MSNHIETWLCTECGDMITAPDTPTQHDLRKHSGKLATPPEFAAEVAAMNRAPTLDMKPMTGSLPRGAISIAGHVLANEVRGQSENAARASGVRGYHEFPYDRAAAAARASEKPERVFNNEVMGEFTSQLDGPYTLPPVENISNPRIDRQRYTRWFESPHPHQHRAEFILRVARADDIEGRPPVPTLKIVIGRELNPPIAPYETPTITPEKAMERDAKAIASGLRRHLPGGTYDRLLIELMRERSSALHVARDGFSTDEVARLRRVRDRLAHPVAGASLEEEELRLVELAAVNKLLDHAGFAP
jgi:hypothetical protein